VRCLLLRIRFTQLDRSRVVDVHGRGERDPLRRPSRGDCYRRKRESPRKCTERASTDLPWLRRPSESMARAMSATWVAMTGVRPIVAIRVLGFGPRRRAGSGGGNLYDRGRITGLVNGVDRRGLDDRSVSASRSRIATTGAWPQTGRVTREPFSSNAQLGDRSELGSESWNMSRNPQPPAEHESGLRDGRCDGKVQEEHARLASLELAKSDRAEQGVEGGQRREEQQSYARWLERRRGDGPSTPAAVTARSAMDVPVVMNGGVAARRPATCRSDAGRASLPTIGSPIVIFSSR
jgi:hypothetical protein